MFCSELTFFFSEILIYLTIITIPVFQCHLVYLETEKQSKICIMHIYKLLFFVLSCQLKEDRDNLKLDLIHAYKLRKFLKAPDFWSAA